MAEDELRGKLALVTGGGRGIGRAIVLALAERGVDVLVNYLRHADAADETATAARALGVRAESIRGNVGDERKIEQVFEEIDQRFGALDILVNNAASGVNRAALDLTAHHWDWTLNINARGAWLCSRAAAPLMRGRDGVIVNISSLGASRVMADYFSVGVSKAALEAVTRYLSVELAPLGVRVNGVSGGLVETDGTRVLRLGPRRHRQHAGAHAGRAAGRAARPGAGGAVPLYPRRCHDPRPDPGRGRRHVTAHLVGSW